jgi:hypothetical protein
MVHQPSLKAVFRIRKKTIISLPKKHQLETWDIQILIRYLREGFRENDPLTSFQLQIKTIIILCIATMWRPRSDIGRIQYRDVLLSGPEAEPTRVTIFVREPKEGRFKHTRLGAIQDQAMCPVFNLKAFCTRTQRSRQSLPTDHSLFLARIDGRDCYSIETGTVASYHRNAMKEAGINTKDYTPQS